MSCLRLFSSALYNQLVNITSAAILVLVIYTMEHYGKERVKGHRAVLTTPITVLQSRLALPLQVLDKTKSSYPFVRGVLKTRNGEMTK